MHPDYQREVFRWLDDIRGGVRTFDDYLDRNRDSRRLCQHDDRLAAQMLRERGLPDEWPTYERTLSAMSNRLPANYPRKIMLDSGAYTAWNANNSVSLDEVKAVYERFLSEANGLFDEVWLVNLDVIPGKRGCEPRADELYDAQVASDANLVALRAAFGDRVLPVFHQGEGKTRLLEVVDQARDYLCISPTNGLPEDQRWRWTTMTRHALADLNCDARTHGLATTGNDMIRMASLYSGDSAAWKQHAFFGVVDLITSVTTTIETPAYDIRGQLRYNEVKETERQRYRGFHIGAERNDWHKGSDEPLIDNQRHFSHMAAEDRAWVKQRVECHVPFALAQLDMRARSLVNIAELQSHAEDFHWRVPGPIFTVTVDDAVVDPLPFYGHDVEARLGTTAQDRARFAAQKVYESL